MAKVSIIVPMYNVEKYVEKCLTSLLNQTFDDIIIYAISDGSPDNSYKIANTMSKKDKRIECIKKENGGYGSVLEWAVNNIKTPYMLICDPDDWLSNECVEKLYNFSISNNLDIAIADKYDVTFDDEKINYSSADYKGLNVDFSTCNEVEKFAFLKCSPHAKLYKTSILKNIIFEHKVSYTDFTLYMVALLNSKKVGYLKEPLAYYLLDRPGNTYTDKTIKAIISHIKVWNSTYNQIISANKKHIYLIYRLYTEYKNIIRLYSKVLNGANKELYQSLVKIKKVLINNKKDILRIKELKLSKKIDIIILLSNLTNLKLYIFIMKIINKNYR